MSRTNAENPEGAIYDSVFKTMVHKIPQTVIPFVNEAFGRDYPLDSEVVQFSNEHESPRGATIDDSFFAYKTKSTTWNVKAHLTQRWSCA